MTTAAALPPAQLDTATPDAFGHELSPGIVVRSAERVYELPAAGRHRRTLALTVRRHQAGSVPDRWVVAVAERFHKDLPERRELELSLRALPVLYSTLAGSATPGILADYLEDYPADVLAVTHRLSRWEKVPGVRFDPEWDRLARERVRESEADALAAVLAAMRSAVLD